MQPFTHPQMSTGHQECGVQQQARCWQGSQGSLQTQEQGPLPVISDLRAARAALTDPWHLPQGPAFAALAFTLASEQTRSHGCAGG